MITKPLKVLVCLGLLCAMVYGGNGWCYTAMGPYAQAGVNAEALSIEDDSQSPPLNISRPTITRTPSSDEGSSYSSGASYPRTNRYAQYPRRMRPRVAPRPCFPFNPAGSLSSLPRLFGLPGLSLKKLPCNAYLPRIKPRQFELSGRLWHTTLNSSTILWGTNTMGAAGTELDLHDDLKLDKHKWLAEWEGRYQLKCKWAMRYSFMLVQYGATQILDPTEGFYFGNQFYSPGVEVTTRWDRLIHRFELVYDWFNSKHAVSSFFMGYNLYDDKLRLISPTLNNHRTRARGFGLASAGMSLDRVVALVGGSMASVHCRWSMQFLQGYLGWDGSAMGRISIPMGAGRFGYLETGWRWMVLKRREPINMDETSLDGIMISSGMVF